MNRQDLLDLSYPSDNEKKLKLSLRTICEKYGFNKAFISLSYTNQFLLNKCNIDENDFNYILFKNYILTLSNTINLNSLLNDSSLTNDEIVDILIFNQYIVNNDIENALCLYENNYTIYQLLCLSYIKNLSKSEHDKIMQLPETTIKETEEKIKLLQNMDLSFKKAEKTYTKQVASAR